MLSLNQQFSGPTNFVRIRFTSRADTDPDHPHLLHHLLKKLLVLVSEDLEKKIGLKVQGGGGGSVRIGST